MAKTTNTPETDIFNLSDGGAKRPGKTLQIFVRIGDETACLCGPITDRAGTLKAIGHCVAAEFDQIAAEEIEDVDICLESYWMTDEEVANLPEL